MHRATEIRFEVDAAEVAVLDGYCQATGKSRGEVMRSLLRGWSDEQLHVATLICRTAGVNPAAPETGRNSNSGRLQ